MNRRIVEQKPPPPNEWLEGWAAIADYVGVSERTAKRYVYRKDPLPVYKFINSVKAHSVALDQWMMRNTVHVAAS